MANEIKAVTSLECTNGNFKQPRDGGDQVQITQAAAGGVGVMVTAIATGTGTVIPSTGLTTPGLARFKNIDAAITVTIGNVTGGVFYPVAELRAGEEALFRWATGAVLYAKSASGTPKVRGVILEN